MLDLLCIQEDGAATWLLHISRGMECFMSFISFFYWWCSKSSFELEIYGISNIKRQIRNWEKYSQCKKEQPPLPDTKNICKLMRKILNFEIFLFIHSTSIYGDPMCTAPMLSTKDMNSQQTKRGNWPINGWEVLNLTKIQRNADKVTWDNIFKATDWQNN